MRLFLIIAAYLAAALIASLITFGGSMAATYIAKGYSAYSFSENLQWLTIFTAVTTIIAFAPALLSIFVSEMLRLRLLATYLVIGLMIGALTLAFAHWRFSLLFDGSAGSANTLRVLWIAGSIAGAFVYWLIAGRSAGDWKKA